MTTGIDIEKKRFRDSNELKYSIRSIEKYATFID